MPPRVTSADFSILDLVGLHREQLLEFLPDDLAAKGNQLFNFRKTGDKTRKDLKHEESHVGKNFKARGTRKTFAMFGFNEADVRVSLDRSLFKLHNTAVMKVMGNAGKQLEIIFNHLRCQEKELNTDDVPHRMFSWRLEDLIDRRELEDFVYIDVMKMQYSKFCLEQLKIKFDLEELLGLLELIFKDCLKTDRKSSFADMNTSHDLDDMLESMEKCLTYEKNLETELHDNKEILLTMMSQSLGSGSNVNVERIFKKRYLQNTFQMSSIIWPMQMRYQKSWLEQDSRLEHNDAEATNELQRNISDYNKRSAREQFASACSMNCMYSQIDDLRNRLDFLMKKYDEDFEKIDNKVLTKRLAITKLKERQKYLSEEIAFFHNEIAEIRAMSLSEGKRRTTRSSIRRRSSAKKTNQSPRRSKQGKA